MPVDLFQAGKTFGPPGPEVLPNEHPSGRLRQPRVTPAGLAAVVTRPAMIAALWLCALVAMLNIVRQLPERATRWDFSIYYVSATLLHEGRNPYTTDLAPVGDRLELETGEIRRATDPPTFLLLMKPFALLPERTAYYAWVGLNAVFLAVALKLLLGRSRELELKSLLALTALVLLYPPIGWHFFAAQSKIPLLLLLAMMIRLMERGSDRTAGLCLAFAGLLRVFPLLLIGYLALQRRWQALIWTLMGLVAGGLITMALLGVSITLSFFNSVLLITGQHVPWMSPAVPANIALGAAVSRLFWFVAGRNPGALVESLRRVVVFGAQATLLGATVAATYRLKPREDPDWRAFSLWVVASVLLSPSAWVYYLVIYIILFVQLISAAAGSRTTRRAQWMAVLSYLAILLTTLPLMPAAGIVYSRYGREWARWFMSLMVEGWFVSAMLAFLAAYRFTVDAPQDADPSAGAKETVRDRTQVLASQD